jgi:hypothetical protein
LLTVPAPVDHPETTQRARPRGRTRWLEGSRLSESNRRPSHYE